MKVERIQPEIIKVKGKDVCIINGIIQDRNELSKDEYVELMRFLRLEKPSNKTTIEQAIKETSELYKVSPAMLYSNSRKGIIVEPRQYAMRLIRLRTDLSLEAIGAEFNGKNHATVINAIRKIDNFIETKQLMFQLSEKPKAKVVTVSRFTALKKGEKILFKTKSEMQDYFGVSVHTIRKSLEKHQRIKGYAILKEKKTKVIFVKKNINHLNK